ncbi:phytanoyl-CoA dioxygenase family protein [Novosphingobium album (ex Liu et al. 2023)]|uniref:Phytanoyl-CoA dioxygenase family protein n=1 Tax=Novosphingobium album (ex Liu et al. 2023) TaxID=3031130 RepID=A0ABT5WXG2_9SPHN|nr:phytanoyl-CoA dioxygenase family protein [Novosphingobium album (ex Liu et al. 2023)]MDE8654600.1 phytanoyl-CoA dioxygenase family protein [Novosphingobium album (ex Liu et al. 2023)]
MNTEDGSGVKTEFPLSPSQIESFYGDGYVIVPGFFSQEEIEPLRLACEVNPTVDGKVPAVADSTGNAQEVIGWEDQSETYLGKAPFMARMIDNAAAILGQPVYHWHSKLSLKRPHTPGRWDWHQDFPFWYLEGCLWPDMLTITTAVDRCDDENGCMRLVKGSHKLGRVDHKAYGEAVAFDPERLELVLQQLETVPMILEPGDACFFHGNTLHASGSNNSDRPRTLFHASYNTIVNTPFKTEGQEHHSYRPFVKLPDSVLRDRDYSGILDEHHFPLREQGYSAGDVGHYGYKKAKVA